MEKLRARLEKIDGQGYKAYKALTGSYDFGRFRLHIDHVQGDPFAEPSRCRLVVNLVESEFPDMLHQTLARRVALEDYLARAVSRSISSYSSGQRGSGKSGVIEISVNGQQLLARNSLLIAENSIEGRIRIALPADGRRILGKEAMQMFFDELPRIVSQSLFYAAHSAQEIKTHVDGAEDQSFLRDWLEEQDLICFVADGSILPRASGIDDRPMTGKAVAFVSPSSLAKTICLPNAGEVRGMAIKRGVNLIIGGGFHGKSTLLRAIELGVYNHIPGDGRQLIATESTAMKIRAEDGRAISSVDISPFINNLPMGGDTRSFSTVNASGSTSQAANISEAIMAGCRTLLIDEDTSATNFMIADKQMRALISPDKEPITPLVAQIRHLYEQLGVSTILVTGGSSAFVPKADMVLMMDNYQARDLSGEAKGLINDEHADQSTDQNLSLQRMRPVDSASIDPSFQNKAERIRCYGLHALVIGEEELDLSKLEQLVDRGQTEAIGFLLLRAKGIFEARRGDLSEVLTKLTCALARQELDTLTPFTTGKLAIPRAQEAIAALNRLRGLKILDL